MEKLDSPGSSEAIGSVEQSNPSSSNRDDAILNSVELVKQADRLDDSMAMAFLAWLLTVSPDPVLEIIKVNFFVSYSD